MGLTQTVAPTSKVISLDEAKRFLRIDHTDEDGLIDVLIEAATRQIEITTARQLITATYAYTLDRYPRAIRLPKPPLGAVSSIQYVDTDGNTQTEASSVYTVVSDQVVAYIVEAYNQTWSSTRDVPNAVTVTYTAGYGVAAAVPEILKQAVKMMVVDLYENRGATTELRLQKNDTIGRLIWPYRVSLFA